tara:strand:+ start:9745 stop:12282 length:2538 start_codon:yes stop_codon:yes gene_type:complete
MIDKVNTLIDAIRPARLIKDLGLEIHSNKECYFINEPGATSNYLFLKDREFVNSNPNADFFAGNIISFLVHYENKTFEEAIDAVLKQYFNKLSQPIYSSISWASSSMASYLEAQHTLFSKIQEHKKLLTEDTRYSTCQQYLRKIAFHENYVKSIVAPFTGEELGFLFDSISHEFSGLSKYFSKKKPYLVFPIHTNYSSISALWVFCVRTKKITKFQITPHSRGFFGMHNLRPNDSSVYVAPTVADVLSDSGLCYDHGGDGSQACLSIVYNEEKGTIMPDPLYRGLMVISEETKTEDVVKIQSSFHELGLLSPKQKFKAGFDQAREARTYLVNKFIMDVSQETDEDVLIKQLQELKSDPILIDRIRNFLKSADKQSLLSLVESDLSKSEIKNIKGSIVTQTKDGYVASGKKGKSEVLFTNFTINLDKTVMFKDSSDTYYIGELYTGSKRLPYMLSKKEINQAMHIVNSANASVSSAKDISDIKPPALLDSTFSGVLRGIVADQISNSKIEIGVGRLGWSDQCDTFTAPGWTSTGTSFIKNLGFKHPTMQVLNNFNFKPKTIDRVSSVFNVSNVNILLALVTSMLGRGFHGMSCSPIRMLNNKENRLLLVSLLSVFQQKKTIDLNPNLRVSRQEDKMIPGINGIPIVCSCANSKVIDKLYDPVFTLGSSGLSFTTNADFNYESLSSFSSYYFPHFINDLIQSDGTVFNPDYEDRSPGAMIREGLSALQSYFPSEAWFITKGAHYELESWLCQQPLELFEDAIKLDFKNQKIRINLKELKNSKKAIEYLKESKVGMYKLTKNYLVVDSEPFLKLLSEVFVEVPKMGTCTIKNYKSNPEVADERDSVGL